MTEKLKALFGTEHPVVLITGGGALRVGNVVARTFARQGYHAVIHAHRSVSEAEQTARQLSELGVESLALAADLSNEDEVGRLFSQVDAHFHRLDVLVNCASIWKKRKLEQVRSEEVRESFEVNTLATFLCCQQAGLRMVRQQSGGAIVNVGDWAVVRPYADHAAYFTAKGAIPTLTRTFAVELAGRNPRVRVNAIMPGPVMMPAGMSAEERQSAIRATLVKREGRPDNVAQAALFLAENDFVTGVCLPVDGGRSIYAPE